MSQENVEIVRRILTAWGRGDFRSEAGLFDPQTSFETFMPDAGQNVSTQGSAELGAFTREWFSQWRDYRVVGEQYREVGADKVFVSVQQTGIGRHSGARVDSPGFSVWTLQRGKVVTLSLHYDRREALEAAGLSE
jgi:ketosteroid isomerase-like protein